MSVKFKIEIFSEWEEKVLKEVARKIGLIKIKKQKKKRYYKKMIFSTPEKRLNMNILHEKYVFVPTDKACNNIAVICKEFYIEQSLRELKIFTECKHKDIDIRTYKETEKNPDSIIKRHIKYTKKKNPNADVSEKLPFL